MYRRERVETRQYTPIIRSTASIPKQSSKPSNGHNHVPNIQPYIHTHQALRNVSPPPKPHGSSVPRFPAQACVQAAVHRGRPLDRGRVRARHVRLAARHLPRLVPLHRRLPLRQRLPAQLLRRAAAGRQPRGRRRRRRRWSRRLRPHGEAAARSLQAGLSVFLPLSIFFRTPDELSNFRFPPPRPRHPRLRLSSSVMACVCVSAGSISPADVRA